MEYIANTIRAYSKGVMGNKRHKTEIMISFQANGEKEIHDIFLDKEKVEFFFNELKQRIEDNKKFESN